MYLGNVQLDRAPRTLRLCAPIRGPALGSPRQAAPSRHPSASSENKFFDKFVLPKCSELFYVRFHVERASMFVCSDLYDQLMGTVAAASPKEPVPNLIMAKQRLNDLHGPLLRAVLFQAKAYAFAPFIAAR